jgi:hypothetical protein
MHNNPRTVRLESNEATETATLSRKLLILIALVIGLLVMGGAYTLAVSFNWQGKIEIEILIAIGASLVSSVIFYALYSGIAEERVLRDVASRTAKVATEYSMSLFQSRFENMLPSKIYPATPWPIKEFDQDFNKVLHESRIYYFKGGSADFTSFRLANLFAEGASLLGKDIVIILLDPTELRFFEERAQTILSDSCEVFSKEDLADMSNRLRLGVFVTLVALFDICQMIRVVVTFHKEHLFFRMEMFEGGMFLTYYVGGEFPGTYFYPAGTFSYKAYLQNFNQSYQSGTPHRVFDTRTTENELASWLEELGCKYSIEDLRKLKHEVFERYRKMITY